MNITNKILIIAIILLALAMAWLGDHVAQLQKLQRLSDEISQLKAALSECNIQARDANAAIEKQNAAIEAIRIDTVIVERRVSSVIDKYNFIRETVRVNLKEDSSCESELKNIDFVLRRFAGAELRPANGD